MSDDPMADFLAREKAALGDDADLFASGETPSAPSGVDDFASFESPTTPAPPQTQKQNSDSLDDMSMSAFPDISADANGAGNSDVRVTGAAGLGEDEDREKFESNFPDLSGEVGYEAAPKPVFNALAPQPYGASPYPAPSSGAPRSPAPGSAYGVLPAPAFGNTLPPSNEDSEPIKAWRAKQAEEIKARDERDKRAREEMRGKAEKSIDEFYEGYNKVKERNIRENKENEAAFMEKLSEGTAKGTSWERVTALIELENSQSKTIRPSVPGGSDLARMKEILLALKREGDKAPGAAGF